MGLPAIVQHPLSMTEVETKAAAEAIFASSNLAICVAPASAKTAAASHQDFQRHAVTRKYAYCPIVKGNAGECASPAY